MADAGKVDRGALAAADFLDGLIVVLQRTDSHTVAARLPFQLVADAQSTGRNGTGNDGSMTLHNESAIDGQAKPFFAAALLDAPAGVGDSRLQFGDARARLRGGGNDRRIFQERTLYEFAYFQFRDLARDLVHKV